MPVYVDSCVLLDIMTDDELFAEWSEKILSEYRPEGLGNNSEEVLAVSNNRSILSGISIPAISQKVGSISQKAEM